MIQDPSRVLPDIAAAMIWLGLDPTDMDALNENKSRIVDCSMYLSQAAENGDLRYYDKKLLQEIPVENTQRTEKVFSYSFTMQSLLDFAKPKNHRLGTQSREKTNNAAETSPISPNHIHVSDKLVKMNQAAAKFWANADRDDRGTQPDNATVAAWLEQQGFSQTLADKAATIIRPEWAPPGRKPEE